MCSIQSALSGLSETTIGRLFRAFSDLHAIAFTLPRPQVGHNALGAGKIIAQGAALVDIALNQKSMFSDSGWQYIKPAFASNTLHVITLLSSGGVHSRTTSFKAS